MVKYGCPVTQRGPPAHDGAAAASQQKATVRTIGKRQTKSSRNRRSRSNMLRLLRILPGTQHIHHCNHGSLLRRDRSVARIGFVKHRLARNQATDRTGCDPMRRQLTEEQWLRIKRLRCTRRLVLVGHGMRKLRSEPTEIDIRRLRWSCNVAPRCHRRAARRIGIAPSSPPMGELIPAALGACNSISKRWPTR